MGVLNFIILGFFIGLICLYCYDDLNYDDLIAIMVVSFTISFFSSFFLTSLYLLHGLGFFRTIKRLTEDTTEKSIMPLFDNGYSLELENLNSKFFFTTECLKGTISGLPVNVSFSQAYGYKWPSLGFSFSSLSESGFRNNIIGYICFNLNIRNRLKRDIKPEVLKFAADLNAKGYSPSGK